MAHAASARALLDWLRSEEDAFTELLVNLALVESPSPDRAALRKVFDLIAPELEADGFVVRAVAGATKGPHLYARPAQRSRGAPRQLLVGHTDTVWPHGTLRKMPIRREEDRLYGPGVYDMKAGLVEIVFALRALAACGLQPEVVPVVFLNSDEEIGSGDSTPWLRLLAQGADRAFVLEAAAGREGRLKTARKGVGRFRVVVRGRAAHAGTEPEHGVSAILELAKQIERLFALNDPARGITVNVGTVDGGIRPNVIAPEAVAVVDVRVRTQADALLIEHELAALAPTVPDAKVEVTGAIGRRPMERTAANAALFAAAAREGRLLGLEIEEAPVVGGASDGNTTNAFTATLDGLGPLGGGAHAADEHVLVSHTLERAGLLALLLLLPARPPRSRRGASKRTAAVLA
jgi:glutamate carboxypeptidase